MSESLETFIDHAASQLEKDITIKCDIVVKPPKIQESITVGVFVTPEKGFIPQSEKDIEGLEPLFEKE